MNIGFKSGVYSIITAAHIESFAFIKHNCDYLYVMINNDDYVKRKKGIVVLNQEERKKILESIKYIDKVVIYNESNEEECLKRLLAQIDTTKHTTTLFHSPEILGLDMVPGRGLVDNIIYTPKFNYTSTTQIFERIRNGSGN